MPINPIIQFILSFQLPSDAWLIENVTSYGLPHPYTPPAFFTSFGSSRVDVDSIVHLEVLSRPRPWHVVLWAQDGRQLFRHTIDA